MKEWDIFQGILDNFASKLDNQSKFITMLLIIGSVNVVGGIFSIFMQFRLLNAQSKANIKGKKDEKGIEIQSELYNLLNSMSHIINDENTLLARIRQTESYINSNNLFITHKLKILSLEICDYYKEILTDYRKKDFKKESVFLNKYKEIYEK